MLLSCFHILFWDENHVLRAKGISLVHHLIISDRWLDNEQLDFFSRLGNYGKDAYSIFCLCDESYPVVGKLGSPV